MKKQIFTGCLVICSIIFLQSCVNNDGRFRKEIVGKWSYSLTEESEEDGVSTIISFNGSSTFNATGNCEDNGIATITYIDEDGNKTTMKYKLGAFGKYEIKNSYITYDYNLENIEITLLKSENYELSNLFEEHYIPQLKQDLCIDNTEKIIELNDKYLKTEEDVDGEKIAVTYIKHSERDK